MDKKTLDKKTVKELRLLSTSQKLIIPAGILKDDLVTLIVNHHKKQQRAEKRIISKQGDAEGTKHVTFSKPIHMEAKSSEKNASEKSIPSKAVRQVGGCRSPNRKNVKSGSKEAKPVQQKTSDGRYVLLSQLGSVGKEGTTFLVKNRKGDEYAMKQFSKQKSATTLQKEGGFQSQVSKFGLAPKIKEVNEDGKYIVMDKLDRNLFDIVKKHQGEIPDAIQRKIVGVITKMDETGVFHGDPNPANFMLKGSTMYMIDYGFARDIDEKLIKKYETKTPNKKFMILGLILKLKEIYREHNPNLEYKVLSKMLN